MSTGFTLYQMKPNVKKNEIAITPEVHDKPNGVPGRQDLQIVGSPVPIPVNYYKVY